MRDTGTDIRGYIELLWSGKWWVLGTALLGGIVAILLSLQQTPTYESDAKVLVEPIALSPTDPEQKIGRPRQLYVGATRRQVVPIAQRRAG